MVGRACGAAPTEPIHRLHAQALAEFRERATDKQSADSHISPEAAFRVLLRGRDEYIGDLADINLALFDLARLSLPESVVGCPDIADVLPEEPPRFLEGNHKLMMGAQQELNELNEMRGEVMPYTGPVLIRNRRAHLGLVRRLQDIGLIDFTTRPLCRVGVFFVWKKRPPEAAPHSGRPGR